MIGYDYFSSLLNCGLFMLISFFFLLLNFLFGCIQQTRKQQAVRHFSNAR